MWDEGIGEEMYLLKLEQHLWTQPDYMIHRHAPSNLIARATFIQKLQSIWHQQVYMRQMELVNYVHQQEVYMRQMELVNYVHTLLHEFLADSESELASLQSLLGDRPCMVEKRAGTLRQQLVSVIPQIEVLRLRKDERVKQFQDVQRQIQTLAEEIRGEPQAEEDPNPAWSEDLSLRKLHEYNSQLQSLQVEKNERLQKLLEHLKALHGLCLILGLDYSELVGGVHPSLQKSGDGKSISDETLEKLKEAIDRLLEERSRRLHKIQELGAALVELWNLMDTPFEERQAFRGIAGTTAATPDQLSEPESLTMIVVEQTEAEFERLNQLKITRMKELVLKKQAELEEICKSAQMECDPDLTNDKVAKLIDSGIVDPAELLANIEASIARANEQSRSRRDLMEKMEKWLRACDEASWLEEYSKDESRCIAKRHAHQNLKRAERARALVTKLPAMLESLKFRARSWEEEKGESFLCNGLSLLAMLDEYTIQNEESQVDLKRMSATVLVGMKLDEFICIACDSAAFVTTDTQKKSLTKALRKTFYRSSDGQSYLYSKTRVDKFYEVKDHCVVAWAGNYDVGLQIVKDQLSKELTKRPDLTPWENLQNVLTRIDNKNPKKECHFLLASRWRGRLILSTLTRKSVKHQWESRSHATYVTLGSGRSCANKAINERYVKHGNDIILASTGQEELVRECRSIVEGLIGKVPGVAGDVRHIVLRRKPK